MCLKTATFLLGAFCTLANESGYVIISDILRSLEHCWCRLQKYRNQKDLPRFFLRWVGNSGRTSSQRHTTDRKREYR